MTENVREGFFLLSGADEFMGDLAGKSKKKKKKAAAEQEKKKKEQQKRQAAAAQQAASAQQAAEAKRAAAAKKAEKAEKAKEAAEIKAMKIEPEDTLKEKFIDWTLWGGLTVGIFFLIRYLKKKKI